MCYYTSGGTRKRNWMDEKLFSLSTAKDLSGHRLESGRRRVFGVKNEKETLVLDAIK